MELPQFWHSCKGGGGQGQKYFFLQFFCGTHFCVGHDAKKKFAFFFWRTTTPCAGNSIFSQILRICTVTPTFSGSL